MIVLNLFRLTYGEFELSTHPLIDNIFNNWKFPVMDKPKEKNPDLVILGERIKKFRVEKGLTLKMLAHSIHKDAQSISRVETGNLNPTYLYLLEVCKGLNIDIAVLLKDLVISDS